MSQTIFPYGRTKLAEEATKFASDWITDNPGRALASGDVLAAHLAGPLDDAAKRAAAEGFRKWEALLRDAFESNGMTTTRAETLAVSSIASVEGALILARAEGSTRPLEQVGAHIQRLIAEEFTATDA